MKILVTGGTGFVSRFVAEHFAADNDVWVLNRNTRRQSEGVHLIAADRNSLADRLKPHRFDAVIDVCAYNSRDVSSLLEALGDFGDYILISSSAVYPETNSQSFSEEQQIGANSVWGTYGTDKIAAEQALTETVPSAYILRPPYIYGPMQNLYREPFVFECAMAGRRFFIPKDGSMKLQFFHVRDLCRVIERILAEHPENHILNVGNEQPVDINTFVRLCYEAAGKQPDCVHVDYEGNQRDFFSFYDYEYLLDVTLQKRLLPETIPLAEGLRESFGWYAAHPEDVIRKPYIDFIDSNF